MKRAVIVGATSGIGREVALLLLQKGWQVGVAGRRQEALQALCEAHPGQTQYEVIDITRPQAEEKLLALVDKLGGMDLYFHASGIGFQNQALEAETELRTLQTNGEGFVRMTGAAFRYFAAQGGGRLGAISSIAGVKGLGAAPAYSATKRMQNTYLDALAQLAHMRKLKIRITDIRPGFVDTALLGDKPYPFTMPPAKVAREIVRSLERGRRSRVIDWKYRIGVFFWRLIPRCLWERLYVAN